ncbi:50S ribosomal protein L25/general stress protein Ctc [Hoyosella subflava]|uniref:Large ribosomal subunit protein bL25 n=1 Tax=Hoyosella subflava (strain DSM 45089 / JCM 17490 / NBRC 109087 / DQS3-9A1) TaxID=443218 RepID=F6EQQ0_HOYSD|nr:50S ribosomal protein L25/general stress protein Ctc [Hoyosella subflava]AEF41927.1 50S ribosomal protein L25 [Hoyosella subflava DQS3-9A1]
MADTFELAVEERTEFGKGAARRARRDWKIPAVLYGHGEPPQHLLLPFTEFAAILRSGGTNAILSLNIGGKKSLAFTKSVSTHPIRPVIEHVDLLVVKKGEKISVDIPVVISGEAAPDTLVTQDAGTLTVLADALNIPDEFDVSVEGAEAGTQILASDVKLPAGVELESDPETLVANVTAAQEEEVPEEGAEPEAVEAEAPQGDAVPEDASEE